MSEFENNATQYSGSETTQDLNVVIDNVNELLQDIGKKFVSFWDNLTKEWGSNKAVEFDSNKTTFFGGLNKAKEMTNGFLTSVSASVASLAAGLGGSYSFNERLKPINDETLKLQPSVDGIKGMKISEITAAVDEFYAYVTGKINSFSLPQSISVSDENGNILERFGAKINKLLGDIQEEAQYITDTIKGALETANETAETAVNQALGVLESFFITPASAEGLDVSGAGGSAGGGANAGAGQSYWSQIGQEYLNNISESWNNGVGTIVDAWGHEIDSFGAGAGAVAQSINGAANGMVNAVGDTATIANDGIVGFANTVFDAGQGYDIQSRESYWENISLDYADNWTNFGNATDTGGKILGALEGAGRTIVDAGQTVVNAGSEALDWGIGAVETAANYVSERVSGFINGLLGY